MSYLYTTTLIIGTLSPLIAAFCACKWIDAAEKVKDLQRFDLRALAVTTITSTAGRDGTERILD
jgi:hypothetical protein